MLELDLDTEGDSWSGTSTQLDAAEQRGSSGSCSSSPDPDLLDWALGRSEPADPRLHGVVQLLRAG